MENLIGGASGRLGLSTLSGHVGPGLLLLSTSSGSHWRRVGQCLLMHPGQRDSDSPQHGAHEQPLPLLLLQAEPESTLGQRRLHAGWANDEKTVLRAGSLALGTATSSEQLICQSSNTPGPCVTF